MLRVINLKDKTMTLFMQSRLETMIYDMQHNLCVMLAVDNGIITSNPYWF